MAGTDMRRLVFTLEGKEREAATIWRATHACNPNSRPTVERSDFSYIFTPGGPGTTVIVRRHLCGRAANVTDFSHW